jgi:hypothetical protein
MFVSLSLETVRGRIELLDLSLASDMAVILNPAIGTADCPIVEPLLLLDCDVVLEVVTDSDSSSGSPKTKRFNLSNIPFLV